MWWLWLILSAVLLYWVLPELLWHYAHLGVVASPRVPEDYVCLTFDDGPGEATSAVLDVLQAHGAQATFFCVGREVEAHPECVARMAAEGHEVATHGAVHRSAWLLGPWATFRQVRRGKAQVEARTKVAPRFFRPPWGQFNLALPLAARSANVRPALWSFDPGDWRARQDPEALAQRIVQALCPGRIYLLHDAGGDGRLHTPQALAIALPEIVRQGYRVVSLSELLAHEEPLGVGRSILQAVWGVWESLFQRLYAIERIGDSRSVLRIGRVHYRGLPATLKDGQTVKAGDSVGELHFRNPQIAALGLLRAMPVFERTMRDLAQVLEHDPKYRDIEVFFGISVAFRGARRFGFEVKDLDFTPMRRFFAGSYLRWVMSVYHPQGVGRLTHRRELLEPKGVFITRETILARYGGEHPPGSKLPRHGQDRVPDGIRS